MPFRILRLAVFFRTRTVLAGLVALCVIGALLITLTGLRWRLSLQDGTTREDPPASEAARSGQNAGNVVRSPASSRDVAAAARSAVSAGTTRGGLPVEDGDRASTGSDAARAAAGGLPDFVVTEGLEQYEFFEAQSLKILRAAEDLRKPGSRERLVARLEALEALHEQQVAARASALGLPLRRPAPEGEELEALIGFEGDTPIYLGAANAAAAVATGASYIRQNPAFDAVFGADIDGAGFGAGVFELYGIYAHEEFRRADGTSRIVDLSDYAPGSHATHVAGTIGAQGLDPAAKGMAPAVTIYGWRKESAAKYASRAIAYPGEADRMVVTNTSLGSSGTGRYTEGDQARDEWARLFPYTIMFQCAGNAGPGFETLNAVSKEAKNHFTVGNIWDITRDANGAITSGITIQSSSRGPTDDGRIKPEIVANGYRVYSTDKSAGAYYSGSGTSYSTPNAAGSAILLQDYFSKRFPGHLMRSDTLKGLIIHTADDVGNTGPDYTYGYGVMNVHAAAGIIKDYADRPAGRRLSHVILRQGETHSRTLTYSGSGPIRVTLAWLDPAGPVSAYDNDRTPALVNDLDVRLVAPSGAVHYPWMMPYVLNGFNPADRGTPAVRGDNTVDNAELVLIDAPTEVGVYTVTVTHKGALQGGEQAYSLFLSGFAPPASAPAPALAAWTDLGDGWYRFEGTDFMLGARVILASGSVEIVSGQGMQVAASRIVCRFDAAPAEGMSFVVVNPDGQASAAEFSIPTGAGILLTANEATWTYAQNFDSLTKSTSTPEAWTDDPAQDGTAGLKGWHVSYHGPDGAALATVPQILGNSGTSGTGSLYSYGAGSTATDRALGSMRQDALTQAGGSVRMGLRLVNRTGRTLTGFTLRFYGEQWRRSSNSLAQHIDAAYAIFPEGQGTLADGPAPYQFLARFEAPQFGSYSGNTDGNASANRALIETGAEGLAWAPGEELWLRWLTPNFTGFDAGLAIDDLVFSATWTPAPTPYEAWVKSWSLEGTAAGPEASPAGDGVANVLKFALGASPLAQADPAFSPRVDVAEVGEQRYFTMTFSLGNAMNWDIEARALRGAGIILWLEQSEDLQMWGPALMQPAESAWKEEMALLPAGTGLEFRHDEPFDAATLRRFFRLRAEPE